MTKRPTNKQKKVNQQRHHPTKATLFSRKVFNIVIAALIAVSFVCFVVSEITFFADGTHPLTHDYSNVDTSALFENTINPLFSLIKSVA